MHERHMADAVAALPRDCVYTVTGSPVGRLMLAATAHGLAAVLWERERPGRVRLSLTGSGDDHPVLAAAARQLDEYFAGTRTGFDLPLDPAGTPFQQDIWRALRKIPFGATRSYAAIAQDIGRPGAARAVGAASGRNPLGIVIPCHRVVGAAGALTGFAGGLDVKAALLAHERRVSAVGRPAADAPLPMALPY